MLYWSHVLLIGDIPPRSSYCFEPPPPITFGRSRLTYGLFLWLTACFMTMLLAKCCSFDVLRINILDFIDCFCLFTSYEVFNHMHVKSWTLGKTYCDHLTDGMLFAYPPIITDFTATAVHHWSCSRLQNIEYRTHRPSTYCFFRSANRYNGHFSR